MDESRDLFDAEDHIALVRQITIAPHLGCLLVGARNRGLRGGKGKEGAIGENVFGYALCTLPLLFLFPVLLGGRMGGGTTDHASELVGVEGSGGVGVVSFVGSGGGAGAGEDAGHPRWCRRRRREEK